MKKKKLGIKAQSAVTAEGEEKTQLIEGVIVRPAVRHLDDRGTLTEIWDSRWGIEPEPATSIITATIRPGKIKGWSIHEEQVDRLFFFSGAAKIVLYDNREGSPTQGVINEIYAGEEKYTLVVIPTYIYHAVQNVGNNDVVFVSLPTTPYKHENPDRFRVAPNDPKIPYDFSKVSIGK